MEGIANKIRLVFFHASWCGTCQTMLPIFTCFKKELQEDLLYLEIDTDTNPLIAASFHIRSVPSLLLFKNGEVFWQYAGLITFKELINQIKKHL